MLAKEICKEIFFKYKNGIGIRELASFYSVSYDVISDAITSFYEKNVNGKTNKNVNISTAEISYELMEELNKNQKLTKNDIIELLDKLQYYRNFNHFALSLKELPYLIKQIFFLAYLMLFKRKADNFLVQIRGFKMTKRTSDMKEEIYFAEQLIDIANNYNDNFYTFDRTNYSVSLDVFKNLISEVYDYYESLDNKLEDTDKFNI